MSHCICLWILALSLGGALEAGVGSDPRWDRLVAGARTIDPTPPVSSAMGSWRFSWISATMIRVGKEEDFHRLLSDEHPVVRCMGLLALARVRGKAAVPALRSHLYDPGELSYTHEVDRICVTVVGDFVWQLLLDANYCGCFGVPVPPLTESERIGLEIELLAADSFVAGAFYVPRHLEPLVRDGTLPLQMTTLRAYAPTLEDYRIIKGLGRLKPSGRQAHPHRRRV